MVHVRSCPHQCDACKQPKTKWKLDAWLHNGACLICGGWKEAEATYACDDCWDNLSIEEQNEAKAEADKYV